MIRTDEYCPVCDSTAQLYLLFEPGVTPVPSTIETPGVTIDPDRLCHDIGHGVYVHGEVAVGEP